MHRGYVIIIFLLLSSLACGFFSTATQAPQAINSTEARLQLPVPQVTNTSKPATTQAPVCPRYFCTHLGRTDQDPLPHFSVGCLSYQRDRPDPNPGGSRNAACSPSHPVPVVLLSPDQLRQNVINDFLADYTDEQVADDVLELSTIGLLEPNFDLRTFYVDLLSEQVAGYYDNETGEMFVVQGQGFQGPERLTYSHEFTHVLAGPKLRYQEWTQL